MNVTPTGRSLNLDDQEDWNIIMGGLQASLTSVLDALGASISQHHQGAIKSNMAQRARIRRLMVEAGAPGSANDSYRMEHIMALAVREGMGAALVNSAE